MRESIIRVPDSLYPIIVEPKQDPVVVTRGGKVIADTRRALSLHEAGMASVIYIPRRDVDMSALSRSSTSRYCPYKGEAAYFSILSDAECTPDCAWIYGMPYWAVRQIEDHIAFDPERVQCIGIGSC